MGTNEPPLEAVCLERWPSLDPLDQATDAAQAHHAHIGATGLRSARQSKDQVKHETRAWQVAWDDRSALTVGTVGAETAPASCNSSEK